MFNRSYKVWGKTILTLQVLLFSEANSLISPLVISKSSSSSNVCSSKTKSTFDNILQSNACVNDNLKMSCESESRLGPSGVDESQRYTATKNVLLEPLPGNQSVHTANITEVHNVPFTILIRPFPSVLDEDKVLSLMKTLQNKETANQVPPLDIMWVKGRQGGDYYYSFGGCHRYEAYKRLQRQTVPCKLFKSSVENLRPYLGASTPDLL